MTYIYGLFVEEEVLYIGQTKDVDKRKLQHMRSIADGTHSVKALRYKEDVEMRVICTLDTDNSFLIMLVEALYNSIHKPKNGIVWQSGRNTVRFKRIDPELAERLLGITLDYIK